MTFYEMIIFTDVYENYIIFCISNFLKKIFLLTKGQGQNNVQKLAKNFKNCPYLEFYFIQKLHTWYQGTTQ